jgi:hypothetical protein
VKVGVSCVVNARKIVGPIFLTKIKCGRYVQVILGKTFPELTEEEIHYTWLQQDSVTAHTARMSM